MNSDYTIGALIGLAIGAVIWLAVRSIRHYIGNRIDEEMRRLNHSLFTRINADTSQAKNNSLAKQEETPQNIVADILTATIEPPFWKNPAALRQAREEMELIDDPLIASGPLAGLTKIEAWQQIDTALLDLENVDDTTTPQ